ncbi:acyl-CoA N-acyltransferase [Kalaharituber pfeilii]|nr:acyl-CoA N-acyltransferase [Kalaharituber pfeilii]
MTISGDSPPSSSLPSSTSQPQPDPPSPTKKIPIEEITFSRYRSSEEPVLLPAIRSLISADLSEPYSIYVYRYFLYQWGDLCFLASHNGALIGVIIAKLEPHRGGPLRGYIAMLAVRSQYRGIGIATVLVSKAIDAMIERGADEVALETEVTNTPAMKLYERLGFLRSKRLYRYYLSGNSAYRLILYLKEPQGHGHAHGHEYSGKGSEEAGLR